MEKVWLHSYPEGVPAEINPETYASVVDIFHEACHKYAEKPAFSNMGHQLSYTEIRQQATYFAAYLQQHLGLPKGARVAIMLPNLLQYPIALLGTLQAGLVVVNVNPLYTPTELIHQLKDAGVEAIVALENFAHILEKALHEVSIQHVIITKLGDSFPFAKRHLVNFVVKNIKKMVPSWHIAQATPYRTALAQGKKYTFTPVPLTGEDIAFLQYTGGTTGVSKGAILTHGNIVSNMLQAQAWIAPVIQEGKEIIITALPLYHIFSLLANCMTFLACGALNVLITNPRDISGFIAELKKTPFTAMTGVNTLFNALLNHPKFAELDFRHFRLTLGGGMAVQKAVAEKWKRITGKPLLEAYGLTETSPAVTINPLNLTAYNGSIGLPIPSTDISIRDPHNQALPIGEIGELCIKGPQVMRAYWQNPEETAQVFTPDGWLRTGDIAKIDEQGFVYLVDRKKDMVLVSGFNVYPNEVENVLASHPDILEAGVVGEPDKVSGEIVKAVIVRKTPSLTEEAIIQHCRQYLTGYKIPKIIEFRDFLPKSNVGKILRRALRTTAE